MDADLIRIVLAVTGGLVIAGLYWWERRRESEESENAPESSQNREPVGEKREPRLSLPEGQDLREAEPSHEEPRFEPIRTSQPGGGRSQARRVASSQRTSTTDPTQVVVVHVLAEDGQKFAGVDLVHAAERCGLEPGEMDIFHCYLGEEPNRQRLFSMANLIKPGTFPFGAMAEFQTPGLTLFATLDGSPDDPGRIEELLGTAHSLAETLSGTLLDEHRQPLTPERERQLHDRVFSLTGD